MTVLWIVGLTNAFNMLDNMDGLAASVGLIAAPAVLRRRRWRSAACSCRRSCWCVVGALGGFLVHNRAPARLFMGDAGSNFLGFLLGCADGRRDVHRATGVFAVQRAGAAAGDGGAAVRHELGRS